MLCFLPLVAVSDVSLGDRLGDDRRGTRGGPGSPARAHRQSRRLGRRSRHASAAPRRSADTPLRPGTPRRRLGTLRDSRRRQRGDESGEAYALKHPPLHLGVGGAHPRISLGLSQRREGARRRIGDRTVGISASLR